MGVVNIVPTNLKFERNSFDKENSLRSPMYTYNLLKKFKVKKCAFCDCNVEESIQGAHVWPVAEIKKDKLKSYEEKLKCAIDGENGLWLCNNHHKWFDSDIIRISLDGDIVIDSKIDSYKREFIKKMTTKDKLSSKYLTPEFEEYLKKRYAIK